MKVKVILDFVSARPDQEQQVKDLVYVIIDRGSINGAIDVRVREVEILPTK